MGFSKTDDIPTENERLRDRVLNAFINHPVHCASTGGSGKKSVLNVVPSQRNWYARTFLHR